MAHIFYIILLLITVSYFEILACDEVAANTTSVQENEKKDECASGVDFSTPDPTLKPDPEFNPEKAKAFAQDLNTAVQTGGEAVFEVVNNILMKHVLKERLEIGNAYFENFKTCVHEDVQKNVEDESFKALMNLLFKSKMEIYVNNVQIGLDGKEVVNQQSLIEIIITLSQDQKLKDEFMAKFQECSEGKTLDAVIAEKYQGSAKDTLIELLKATRNTDDTVAMDVQQTNNTKTSPEATLRNIENTETLNVQQTTKTESSSVAVQVGSCQIDLNNQQVIDDAKALQDESENWPGTVEKVKSILFTASSCHLRAVSMKFKETTQKLLHEVISEKIKDDLGLIFGQIAYFANNAGEYYACNLENAIKDIKTQYMVIIRIVLCHSEFNLNTILTSYEQKYSKSFYSAIQETSSGPFSLMIGTMSGGEQNGDKGTSVDTSNSPVNTTSTTPSTPTTTTNSSPVNTASTTPSTPTTTATTNNSPVNTTETTPSTTTPTTKGPQVNDETVDQKQETSTKSTNSSSTCTATVKPAADFNAEKATSVAQEIDAAIKSTGTEKFISVNKVLVSYSYQQRLQIKEAYQTQFKSCFVENLDDGAEESYKYLVSSMFKSYVEIYIQGFQLALNGSSIDKQSIFEIMVSVCQTKELREEFKSKYIEYNSGVSLEQTISESFNETEKETLLEMLKTDRVAKSIISNSPSLMITDQTDQEHGSLNTTHTNETGNMGTTEQQNPTATKEEAVENFISSITTFESMLKDVNTDEKLETSLKYAESWNLSVSNLYWFLSSYVGDLTVNLNKEEIQTDAKALQTESDKWPNTMDTLRKIIVKNSYEYIQAVSIEYQKLTQKHLHEMIAEKFKDDSGELFRHIAYISLSVEEYFASILETTIKAGSESCNYVISRIAVIHSELNLGGILQSFQAKYSKKLTEALQIKSDSPFGQLMLSLSGEIEVSGSVTVNNSDTSVLQANGTESVSN